MKIPLLKKKRSRYQRARDIVREMLPQRTRGHSANRSRHADAEDDIPGHDDGFAGLHWMTAGLFLAAGAEAALGQRRGDHRPADTIRWAPVIAAPMAGAAQAARAIWPSATTRLVSQLVNGIAVGVGAAGLISSIRASLRDREYEIEEDVSTLGRVPSLAPLAFGAVGLLGMLLDKDQAEAARAVPARSKPQRSTQAGTGKRREIKRIRVRV